MAKVDQKSKKQLVVNPSPHNLPLRPGFNCPVVKQSQPPAVTGNSREVMALDAKYADLLKPKEFNFKSHFLPIGAILVFSLVLVVVFHTTKSPEPAQRNVSSDYEEEKVCVDHPDGTKSCTTRTKLRKSFRE